MNKLKVKSENKKIVLWGTQKLKSNRRYNSYCFNYYYNCIISFSNCKYSRLVMNGGIIEKASTSTEKYSDEEVMEQIKLAYSEWQMAQWTESTNSAEDFMLDDMKFQHQV